MTFGIKIRHKFIIIIAMEMASLLYFPLISIGSTGQLTEPNS